MMKFDCGPTASERRKAKEKWHRFFCLFPRRMTYDAHGNEPKEHDCRWLEFVYRRAYYTYSMFDFCKESEYKPIR